MYSNRASVGVQRSGRSVTKGKLWGAMDTLILFIALMVSHLYTYVKPYQSTHFIYVQFIIYRSSPKKFV